jgi:hypothetical protein
MSWDIILFSSSETIKSVADLNEDKLLPTDFDKVLLESFKTKNIEDGYVMITTEAFSVDFSLDDELVSNKLIHLHGEQAIKEIIKIAKTESWQIYDMGSEEMIDLNLPSNNGWAKFNEYLQHVRNIQNPD